MFDFLISDRSADGTHIETNQLFAESSYLFSMSSLVPELSSHLFCMTRYLHNPATLQSKPFFEPKW